jgi:hypothetical protein
MRGPAADAVPAPFVWNVGAVDPATARAFTANTCNGCHTTSTAVETAFHISPFRVGRDKLSPFIRSPNGGPDEISKRTEDMQRALCD